MLIQQRRTGFVNRLWDADPEAAVWWGTRVECHSAIARTLRQNAIDRAGAARALERLSHIEVQWLEVEPSVALRDDACRLLRAHPLRAADALQLAAALELSSGIGERLAMICFDERLAEAARLEQIPIIDANGER